MLTTLTCPFPFLLFELELTSKMLGEETEEEEEVLEGREERV